MAQLSSHEKKLIRRYLIWFYKTNKEEFERIERKFTQLIVDDFVLKDLQKSGKVKNADAREYQKKIQEFELYMNKKRDDALAQKFTKEDQKSLNTDYLYLKNRMAAIEKAIVYFLGKKELTVIEKLYEAEMTRRILTREGH